MVPDSSHPLLLRVRTLGPPILPEKGQAWGPPPAPRLTSIVMGAAFSFKREGFCVLVAMLLIKCLDGQGQVLT